MKMWVCLFVTFFSLNSFALTLQETIALAFDNNPITDANELRLEAQKWDVIAAKRNRWPSGSVTYSYALNDYQSTFGSFSQQEDYANKNWGISAFARIYDGGAGKSRVCMAQKYYEALEGQNTSANTLIPDTLGSLANDIFSVYLRISKVNTQLEFSETQKNYYQTLILHTKEETQKNQIASAIEEIETSIADDMYRGSKDIYNYETELVKKKVPLSFDNLDKIAESILIPETAEEAVEIGLRKNPEIIIAKAYVEAARCSYKSMKAQMLSPKVDLTVDRSSYTSNQGNGSNNIGNSVGLRLSVPLDLASGAYLKGDKLRLQAKENDLLKEIDRLKSDIAGSLYKDLEHYGRQIKINKKSIADNDKQIEELLATAKSNQPFDHYYALSIIGRYTMGYWKLVMNQEMYIRTKFDIQRKIGILFDHVQASKTKNPEAFKTE